MLAALEQDGATDTSRRQETATLEIADLSVTYASSRGPVNAVSSLSLDVKQGEFVSVLGPSGCGKSTLLGIISGLLKPTSGKVLLDGVPVERPGPDVGVVFQQPTLLPWKSVIENVLLPARMLGLERNASRERAEELIDKVGLRRFRDHYPFELSGGMQQRVGIARALIHDPKLLLMDEPFAALDAMTRERMSLELQRIWMEQRKTVVFITHSIPEAVFLSDRIVVMTPSPGRIMKIVDCPIERPRSLKTMNEPDFAELTTELRLLFSELESGND